MIPIQSRQSKPNRVEIPENQKNDKYHLDYARWVLGSSSSAFHEKFVTKYKVNRSFYKNDQWIHAEDTEAFFNDESGQDRHRIKVTKNYIQPMVEQYRGNSERMRFDFKVFNLSPLAKSRRDGLLAKLLNYQSAAEKIPGYKDHLKGQGMPIGFDSNETRDRFENTYTDQYVIAANRLIRSVAELNNLDSFKTKLAMDLAFGGLAVMYPYIHGGDWMFRRVVPYQFGFDTTAQSETLNDAEYFWEYDLESPTTIYEMNPDLSGENRAQIESYISTDTARTIMGHDSSMYNGKIPVYTSVWRDLLVDIFGYVKDEYGQIILARIDYIEPLQEEPKYTIKDVLDVETLTPYQKRVLRGNKTRRLYVDNWRYARFIPNEIVGMSSYGGNTSDVVLEHGSLPYQEPDLYRPTNMVAPYKVGMWSYVDGDILSPVDIAINPQRMINRFLSVIENQLNNASGAGTVYDKDAMGEDDEDEFIAKINRSEPVGIHARGRGVQNYLGRYDGMPKESLMAFNGLIESFKKGMEDTTGVNEGLKGQTTNPDQLVGVMQLMIQRGSILQEPFYKALTDVFKGCYQSIITSARRFYIDNDIDLEDYAGESGAGVIKLSKDMRNESMRVDLERSVDPQTERQHVDQQIMLWVQFGLIDQPTAAAIIGKATLNESVIALRDFHKNLELQKKQAAEQNQMLQQAQDQAKEQAGRVVYGEQVRQEVREDTNKQADRNVKREVAQTKNN